MKIVSGARGKGIYFLMKTFFHSNFGIVCPSSTSRPQTQNALIEKIQP